MYILGYLVGDVDNAERIHHVFHAVVVRQRRTFDKVSGKIDVGTELTGELKALDLALQHRIAPIEKHLAQFHRTLGDTGPVGAFIIHGVRQLHPAIPFQALEIFP